MFQVPNQYRERKHRLLKSTDNDGNNGFFVIPHHRIKNYQYLIQASDGMNWEHVSVSVAQIGKRQHRCPTWEEMCFIKNLFWSEDETVIQYHPAKSDYINMHPFVLHLWKPLNETLPKPDKIMVGVNLK